MISSIKGIAKGGQGQSGTAVPSDVKSGKTFIGAAGELETGTYVFNPNMTIISSACNAFTGSASGYSSEISIAGLQNAYALMSACATYNDTNANRNAYLQGYNGSSWVNIQGVTSVNSVSSPKNVLYKIDSSQYTKLRTYFSSSTANRGMAVFLTVFKIAEV